MIAVAITLAEQKSKLWIFFFLCFILHQLPCRISLLRNTIWSTSYFFKQKNRFYSVYYQNWSNWLFWLQTRSIIRESPKQEWQLLSWHVHWRNLAAGELRYHQLMPRSTFPRCFAFRSSAFLGAAFVTVVRGAQWPSAPAGGQYPAKRALTCADKLRITM